MTKFFTGLVATMLVLAGCGQGRGNSEPTRGSSEPAQSVTVRSAPALMTLHHETIQPQLSVLGTIGYDARLINTISARVSGRIERLYVHYRYQHVHAGQRIMDLYSPELVAGEQDLLFLLKNDPGNTAMIAAARERLRLLGVSGQQLAEVEHSGRATPTLGVYSNYTGHIHEAGNTMPGPGATGVGDLAAGPSGMTEELPIKEGMYVEKGQTVFQVFNMDRSWALLKVFPGDAGLVRKGDAVRLVPETAPDKAFDGKIDEVLPFYGTDEKTGTVRVYFDNSRRDIPIGSQIKATIHPAAVSGSWLPSSALVSLGADRVVFLREGENFRARKVATGITSNGQVQVLSGLEPTDSVATNAQYMIDSEDFVKVKD